MKVWFLYAVSVLALTMLSCGNGSSAKHDGEASSDIDMLSDGDLSNDSDSIDNDVPDDLYKSSLTGQDLICDGIFCSGYGKCVVIDWKPVCDCTVEGYHDEGLACVKNDSVDACKGVTCGHGGKCSVKTNPESNVKEPVCGCSVGYAPMGLKCVLHPQVGCVPHKIGEQDICLMRKELLDTDTVYFPGLQDMVTSDSHKKYLQMTLPSKVEHKTQISSLLKTIPNQQSCGACTAFATTNSLHAMQIKSYSQLTYLSQSHLWSLISGETLNCINGANISMVAQAAMDNYIVDLNTWKYTCSASSDANCKDGALSTTTNNISGMGIYKIASGASTSAKDIDAIKSALAAGYNAICGVPVYDEKAGSLSTIAWNSWGNLPVIDMPTQEDINATINPSTGLSEVSGHAILIIGYDDATQQFDFLNSWSSSWGKGGYGKFTYNFLKNYVSQCFVPKGILKKTCAKTEDCSCGICDQGKCKATQEILNNRDDNCDGRINEGVDCAEGEVRKCGSDIGECVAGTITCKDGKFGNCAGKKDPAIEKCDNKDNNCDGKIDENLTQECGKNVGVCRKGLQTCTNGSWSATCVGEIKSAAKEICGDGLDNDCDGKVDESDAGCVCTNGKTQKCGTDVGACVAGTQTCSSNKWGSCVGEVGPAATEQCNGIDDDCDNQIDENAICDDGNMCTVDSCTSGKCVYTPYSCNNHGTCNGDGKCTCSSNYTGTLCNQCSSGFLAYPYCVSKSVAWYDASNGLMWQAPRSVEHYYWQEATDYCSTLNLEGVVGWRLPTISELRTLVRNCPNSQTGGACGITDNCLDINNSSCYSLDTCKGCGQDFTGLYTVFPEDGQKGTDSQMVLWSSSKAGTSMAGCSSWILDFSGPNLSQTNCNTGGSGWSVGSKWEFRCVHSVP